MEVVEFVRGAERQVPAAVVGMLTTRCSSGWAYVAAMALGAPTEWWMQWTLYHRKEDAYIIRWPK